MKFFEIFVTIFGIRVPNYPMSGFKSEFCGISFFPKKFSQKFWQNFESQENVTYDVYTLRYIITRIEHLYSRATTINNTMWKIQLPLFIFMELVYVWFNLLLVEWIIDYGQ